MIDTAEDMEIAVALLEKLTDIAPCYYVTGNHEWAADSARKLSHRLSNLGVMVMDDRYLLLDRGGSTLLLGGVADPNGPADKIRPDALVENARSKYPQVPFLLLAHRNDWFQLYPTLDVDWILCGHGHGGLLRLPGGQGLIGTDRQLFPPYTEGIHHNDQYTLLISRGLGNSGRSFRVFNPPEIVVINFSKKSSF